MKTRDSIAITNNSDERQAMLYFVKDRIKDMLIVPIEQLKMVFVVRLQCADLVGTTITSHKVAA